jgi:O-antigen/teichoic acid export membrane protein
MSFARASLNRLRSHLSGGNGRYRHGVSALDQMALSVFGFALNLYLIRALSATDFGIVSLWMAMGLLSISVQVALVGSVLSIHLPAMLDPARARRLEEAAAIVSLITTGLTTVAVVATNGLIDAEWAPHDVATAIAIPLFMAAGLSREYYRTLAFSRKDMRMLVWIDAPYLAVTTVCLTAMLVWPERFGNLAAAFFAMSIGCIVSQFCLRGRFGGTKLRPFQRGWAQEYRLILGDVSWALVGVVTTHLRARSYIYVTVNMVSLAGLAAINVVGILFRPVRLMLYAWSRSALPTMAEQLAGGEVRAFDRGFLGAFTASIVASAAWFVILWLLWGPIERYFLAGHYPDAWSLVWPWAIAAGLNVMEFTVSVALQAAREFRFLAFATMLCAPITIAATVAAVLWHGYAWTMYGVAFGNLTMLIIEGGRLYVVRRRFLAQAGLPRSDDIPAAQPRLAQPY